MNPHRVRKSRKKPIKKRDMLFLSCGGVCPNCGRIMQNNNPKDLETYMTIDHIVPKSKGGTNNIENLRGLCRSCNNNRGNADIPGLIAYDSFKGLKMTYIKSL